MNKHFQTLIVALLAGAISAAGVVSLTSTRADQSERVVPTAGVFTGPQYAQLIGDMSRSISTANKGSSAPANVSGAPVDGLEWLDDSVTPWVMKRYINGGWVEEAAYDPTGTPSYIGLTGGGGIGSVASSSTTDLSSVKQTNVSITGTTTIANFGSAAPTGAVKIIRFAAALTLTYSSAMPVPTGGYDLVTAAGDKAVVTHAGSGNWEFISYTRANGIPIDQAAVGEARFTMASSAPTNWVLGYGQALARSSYPAYTAKVSRVQNGTRTNANATIASVANTDGFDVGMPVEGTGINSGCTIASVVANTSITLNSSSCVTSSGTSTITVFLTGYGTGGTSSTVGVPDCRGRTFVSRDHNLPGTFAGWLTATYAGTNGRSYNTAFGSENYTILLANLPPYTPAGSITNGTITSTPNTVSNNSFSNASDVTPGSVQGSYGPFNLNSAVSQASSTFTGTAQGGSSTPHRIVQPSLTADCIVRVTP